jgi:hypothetical protein
MWSSIVTRDGGMTGRLFDPESRKGATTRAASSARHECAPTTAVTFRGPTSIQFSHGAITQSIADPG